MKILRLVFLATLLCTGPRGGGAEENRYDVLAKLLGPFVNLLAKNPPNPNRALSLVVRIEQMSGLPPELADAKAALALQYPDKLLLRGPVLGLPATVCRAGQQVWVVPGAKIEALIEAAVGEKKLPKADPKYRLEPFRLPVPEKQLVFLPALFQVRDGGMESVEGLPCRVLNLALMPELEKSLRDKGWTARVWVGADYHPVRLLLARPGWEAVVRFEKVSFLPKLPDETWQPPAEESSDVLTIDPPRFQQLLKALTR